MTKDGQYREITRYLGYGKNIPDAQTAALIGAVRDEYKKSMRERSITLRAGLDIKGDAVSLLHENGRILAEFTSASLARHLSGCTEAVLFCATLGAGCDRLTLMYEQSNMAKAAIAQACGAAFIEALCDRVCGDMEKEARTRGLCTVSRFSPGYGDLSIEAQRDFISLLDCGKRIGVTLTDALMMTPAKSVTAIVGLKPAECAESTGGGCTDCGKTDCQYRKEQ